MLRFIRIRMHVSRHIWKGDSFLAALTNGITMAKTVVMIMKDGIPVKKPVLCHYHHGNHLLLANHDSVVFEARGFPDAGCHSLQTLTATTHRRD